MARRVTFFQVISSWLRCSDKSYLVQVLSESYMCEHILELIGIGPRWGLNPQPIDPGAPALPTLPSGSVHMLYVLWIVLKQCKSHFRPVLTIQMLSCCFTL